MRYHRPTRRHFLQGLGAGLILPYLPSLTPRAQAALASPRRYIQILTSHGSFGQRFFPSDVSGMAVQGNTGVSVKPLSTITGDISLIIGPAFNGLKGKINLIRGCNVLAGSTLHNGSYPTCASGTNEDNLGNGRPIFPWSADSVMAASPNVYPDPTGKQRQVVFSPVFGSGYDNYSWHRQNGNTQHVGGTHDTAALLAKFTTLGAGTVTPGVDPNRARQTDVVQNVYADYRQLRDSGRLSAEDKARLESYMTLINEVQQDLLRNPSPARTCARPTQEAEANSDVRHRNQLKILVAAMACDLTRVTSYVIDVGYDPMHQWAHDSAVDSHANRQRSISTLVAFLLTEMDRFQETAGTLLDNSIVYYNNEFGELTPADAHISRSMPILTAGGAGGTLETGYYIDFRASGSVPLNNLLVTFFNAMSMPSSDYQREGVVGFGEYNTRAASGALAKYLAPAERIRPLPFLYKGPTLG